MLPAMPSTRSRCLRLCLAAALIVSAASLLLDLGGGDVALLDLAPFLLLTTLTLVWPKASARLVEAVIAPARPRPRGVRRAPRRRRRDRGPLRGGRLLAVSLGGRAPPALLCRS